MGYSNILFLYFVLILHILVVDLLSYNFIKILYNLSLTIYNLRVYYYEVSCNKRIKYNNQGSYMVCPQIFLYQHNNKII